MRRTHAERTQPPEARQNVGKEVRKVSKFGKNVFYENRTRDYTNLPAYTTIPRLLLPAHQIFKIYIFFIKKGVKKGISGRCAAAPAAAGRWRGRWRGRWA